MKVTPSSITFIPSFMNIIPPSKKVGNVHTYVYIHMYTLSLSLSTHGTCQCSSVSILTYKPGLFDTQENLQGACGRVLHTTPSRFTRTNQSRTWNTGNGSPDAICFSVDRPGIVVAGVCVFGGAGTYEYELELLDDVSRSMMNSQFTVI